jgi:hypothetical protein
MTRSPLKNPQPTDVLAWGGWRITVLAREGDSVTYRAAHRDGRSKPETCTLSDWKIRAKGAKAIEVSSERGACVSTGWVSALCEVGAHLFAGHTHVIDDKFYCESHCPNHKPKEKQHAAQ